MPRRILVVGDKQIDRALIAEMLKEEYVVVEAKGSKEAYSKLLDNPYGFSAVIIDTTMPATDGHELVRRIRRSGFMNQIPVIITTGDNNEESVTKALASGANNYITKPIKPALLLAMVQNNVRLREAASIVNEFQKDKLTKIYKDKMRERLLNEQLIVNDTKRALADGEFEPWLQPQYNHATGALIFNSYVGAACILEYCKGEIEMLRASDEFLTMLGSTTMDINDILRLDWTSFMDEQNQRSFRDAVMKSLETREIINCTNDFTGLPGCPDKTYLDSALRVIATTGDRILIYCLNKNITARREAEEHERQAAEQREMLMDNLPWGAGLYAFKDGQMSLIYQNESYWRLVGLFEEDKFPDPAPMSAIHPDDIPLIMQKLTVAIEHHDDVICDIRLRHLKLGFRPVRLVARVVPDETGGFLIVATFVPSEQVEMSYQRVQAQLLSTIMEASNDYAFAKDEDFRYICCSPAFVHLAGIESGLDAVGKTDFELFPADMAEQFRQNDLALLESGKPMVDFDETVHSQDGTPHYCLASKHILRDSGGSYIGIYGVSRDVTKARNSLEQLQLVNDGVPGGIATFSLKDGSMRVVYCNDGFCKLFGGTRKGFEARGGDLDPMEWVLEEDRAELWEQIHQLVESNTAMDAMFRVHVIGGGRKWVNQKASVVERNGGSAQFNAILLDVTERQAANERIRISEEENRLAIQHGGGVICRFDVAARSLTLSPSIAARYSIPEQIFDVPYEPVRQGMISPKSIEAYVGFFEAIIDGSPEENVLYQQRYLGDWRWLEGNSSTIFSDDGTPAKAIISLFDVTDRLEQEAVFKKWQRSMEERPADSYTLFRCNLNRNMSYDTKEGTLFSFDVDEAGLSFNDRSRAYADQCVHQEDRDRYIAFVNSDSMLASYYRGKKSDTIEYREYLPGRSSCRWLRLSIDLAEYPNSSDVEAQLMYESIDEAKKAELETKERTETDPLTGVLNRTTFEARVDKCIRSSRPGTIHALLMLDIDGFKLVNDVFGHGEGDQTLVDIAAQIQTIMRRDDYVGRLGGDEFVVFLNDIPSTEIVARKARQICELSKRNYSVEVQISGSVGIALYPKDGDDFGSLYKKADATLYFVKGSGKNSFAFYRDEIDDDQSHETQRQPGDALPLKELDIKRRMLIVDDSALDCTILTKLFENDFRVDVANDGASALTKMHHYGSALSIVLLDLVMKGMDGYAVLERMQLDASTKGIPVIVISSSEDHDTLLRVISTGASDLVSKPIDPDILRVRVNAAVSKAENERRRAENSLLSMRDDEIGSYQAVLERLGTAVIVNHWIKGGYLYSPSVSALIAGDFDDRPLWRILLSDMVAEVMTVQKMQQLVHDIANNRDRDNEQIIVKLKAKDGRKRDFEMTVFKKVNEFGLTEQMIIALKEAVGPNSSRE